jgi:hypothetical protein
MLSQQCEAGAEGGHNKQAVNGAGTKGARAVRFRAILDRNYRCPTTAIKIKFWIVSGFNVLAVQLCRQN